MVPKYKVAGSGHAVEERLRQTLGITYRNIPLFQYSINQEIFQETGLKRDDEAVVYFIIYKTMKVVPFCRPFHAWLHFNSIRPSR